MRTIETKSGFVFEIYESRKEALDDIANMDFDPEWWDEDSTLYIEYKDGSYFYIGSYNGIDGKFKKVNIKTIIFSNANTTAMYGDFRIYNIDNTEEVFNEDTDNEDTCWNVDVA